MRQRPICDGIKLVELASMVSGPLAGQGLADLGAEVIKIEPLTGDPMRALGASHSGVGSGFLHANRGKKSIALDLKNSQGLAIAHKLVCSADILLENYRPGVLDRLGLGFRRLKIS